MKTLDLRFRGEINTEVSELLNQIAENNINSFNQIISEISKENLDNLNWWVKSPASRNTYSSPLFYRLTCLKLLDELIRENKFIYSKILVDSFEFSSLIKNLLKKKENSKIKVYNTQDFSVITKNIKNNFHKIKTSVFFILKYFVVKILVTKENILSPIKVVDTFLMPRFVKKDRWYASFFNELNIKQIQNLYFIPTIVNSSILDISKIILKSKNINRKIIFKESYISFIDIFYIIFNLFNNKFKIKSVKYLGLEISSIVKEEFRFVRDQSTIIESLIIYKMFNNFYKQNIKIEIAIDWFEGHSIDKSWSFSLNKFFPECKTYGFRGGGDFSLHLCNYPIQVEKEANVIPETFLVPGTGYQKLVSKYLKNIKSIVVPSFRTLHVWDNYNSNLSKNDKKNNFIILVSLPINLEISKIILKLIVNLKMNSEGLLDKPIFNVKTHPAFNTDLEFNKLCDSLPSNIIFKKNKNFNSLLRNSNLLISEASGTCLESMALGVPVIVIKNPRGLFYNPIVFEVPDEMFKFASSIDELNNQILYFRNNQKTLQKTHTKNSKIIRSNYFEPSKNKIINKIIK